MSRHFFRGKKATLLFLCQTMLLLQTLEHAVPASLYSTASFLLLLCTSPFIRTVPPMQCIVLTFLLLAIPPSRSPHPQPGLAFHSRLQKSDPSLGCLLQVTFHHFPIHSCLFLWFRANAANVATWLAILRKTLFPVSVSLGQLQELYDLGHVPPLCSMIS